MNIEMKRVIRTTIFSALLATGLGATEVLYAQSGGYPIAPVNFTAVKVAPNSFWGQRLEACREVTVPLAFRKCEEEGRYDNFVKAAHPRADYKVGGFSFDDTDVYKTIEGASYLLQTFPDAKLVHYIDSVLDVVAAAQEPDGYLYTARTMNPEHPHAWAGSRRWEKVEDLSHEFYNLGHMVEGAIAHYQATGSRKFLDIAIRYADCVCREIGLAEGQQCVVPGHQIAEMALAKLYTVTGEKKYLEQAKFFLDMRGKTARRDAYSQAHRLVTEQDEAVGHAVRAGYMYTGMADVAALTGDTAYLRAIDRIWENIVGKKYYITGGVGATSNGEAFGANYELPNMSAYCETCAAIAQVYLNYRLFLLHGDGKYYDCLERTLYNGVISGMSIDGGAFFYPNPLQSMGQHQRQAWFGCACCPSNICRFIPSLPGYAYAVKDKSVYVNLFMSNTARLSVKGKTVTLEQQTDYPWEGWVAVTVSKAGLSDFELCLRIPGWLRGEVVPSDLYRYTDGLRPQFEVRVNGTPVQAVVEKGYCRLARKWKKGDRVELVMDMPVRTVRAQELVAADRGRIAVERGPLLYCAEWIDNEGFDVLSVLMNQQPVFELDEAEGLPAKGIRALTTKAQALDFGTDGSLNARPVTLKLIPYYAWAHRGSGNMAVWLPQDLNATQPAKAPTLASESRVAASVESAALGAVNDRLVPADGDDRSMPYLHWWPKKGSTEWVTYEFRQPARVRSCTVYWFDDAPWGGCRVPEAWNVQYRDADGAWQPVANPTAYGVRKGAANTVDFDAVQTTALKLELRLPKEHSSGIFEWEVK